MLHKGLIMPKHCKLVAVGHSEFLQTESTRAASNRGLRGRYPVVHIVRGRGIEHRLGYPQALGRQGDVPLTRDSRTTNP